MYSNSCSTFVMLRTLNWGTILLDLYDLDNKTEKSFDLKGCAKHENNSYFTSQQLQAARLKKMYFMMSWYPVMIKLLQSIFKFNVKVFLYYFYKLISKKGNSLEILFIRWQFSISVGKFNEIWRWFIFSWNYDILAF